MSLLSTAGRVRGSLGKDVVCIDWWRASYTRAMRSLSSGKSLCEYIESKHVSLPSKILDWRRLDGGELCFSVCQPLSLNSVTRVQPVLDL